MDDRQFARESHLRSVLKGVTYRVLGTTTTVAIAWSVTASTALALQIGLIEAIAKVAAYYLHERAWQLVPRGTIRRLYRRR